MHPHDVPKTLILTASEVTEKARPIFLTFAVPERFVFDVGMAVSHRGME